MTGRPDEPVDQHASAELPVDVASERALLGALLNSERVAAELIDGQPGDDHEPATLPFDRELLWRPRHQHIYDAIVAVYQRGGQPDPVLVAAALQEAGQLVAVGGGPYLVELMRDGQYTTNAALYVERLRDVATRRALIQHAQRVLQLAADPSRDVDELLVTVRAEVERATTPSRAGTAGPASRLLDGGAFILDAPAEVPALWGTGDDVLWAQGEPLMITGPTGVGKTTIGGQLVAARMGLRSEVLGFDVSRGRRVLYLAMDRPAQIARALGRQLRGAPRDVLNERLAVWKGPPMSDLARDPLALLRLAQKAGADTVIVDSAKDAAAKLSDEETGQGLNASWQHCVAEGVEVLVLHHQTKRGAGGQGKPNSLADVYGSAWLTAGCGSVLLVWGSAGDLVVSVEHLKQPAALVGPLRVVHDPANGTSSVRDRVDVGDFLDTTPRNAREIAIALAGGDRAVGDSDVERARRVLDRLVRDGLAEKRETGIGANGKPAHGYVRATLRGVPPLFDHSAAAGS